MARNIVKSNIVAMAVNHDLANPFSTSDLGLRLFMAVRDLNYSIQLPRQQLKQVGTQELSVESMMNQPDVELTVSYLAQPNLANEYNSNFIKEAGVYTRFSNFFSGVSQNSTNFYGFLGKDQGVDIFDTLTFDESLINLTGFDVIAFGNCFPTTYGLSYSLGSLPIVSTNYICSNVVLESLTGTSMVSPAINLTGGNNDNVGRCDFTFEANTPDDSSPVVLNQTDSNSSITLQNLQVGGQNLSGIHFIQSVDMSVDLPRVSNYGLGNDFAFDRKAQLPARGSFKVSSLVSGLNDGALTGVLDSDQNYDFDLVLASGDTKLIYKIEDAKLASYNYGIAVNGSMTFDADFTFQVTENKGLKVSGTHY